MTVKRQSLALPLELIEQIQADPLCQSLYPSMFGCFERDAEHSIRRSERRDDAIVIAVIDGCGWYEQDLNGQKIPLQAGHLLLVPAHAQHAYGSDRAKPWTIYWSHLLGADVDAIFACLNQEQAEWRHQLGQAHTALWRQCLQLYQGAISLHQVRRASALLRQILSRGAEQEKREQDPFAAVIAYMEAHIHSELSLQALAECVGKSKHHFSRQFQEHYGSPPHRYFLALKMNRAAQDLDNEAARIADIAADYGYEDQFYFSRLFKKVTGYSPMAYRALDKG